MAKDPNDTGQPASGHPSATQHINAQIDDEIDRYHEQFSLTTHGGYPQVSEASLAGRLMEHEELDRAQYEYTEETPDD